MTPAVSPLDGTLFGPASRCFGCSPNHPAGFKLKFEVEAGGDVVTRMVPEAAAWAVLATLGKFGFTTHFEARLSKGVRVGVEVEARARIVKSSSRVVKSVVLLSQEGHVCFTGDFTFVLLDRHAAEKLMGVSLPEEWLKYCR